MEGCAKAQLIGQSREGKMQRPIWNQGKGTYDSRNGKQRESFKGEMTKHKAAAEGHRKGWYRT